MNKVNYSKELDKKIEEYRESSLAKIKKLVLILMMIVLIVMEQALKPQTIYQHVKLVVAKVLSREENKYCSDTLTCKKHVQNVAEKVKLFLRNVMNVVEVDISELRKRLKFIFQPV